MQVVLEEGSFGNRTVFGWVVLCSSTELVYGLCCSWQVIPQRQERENYLLVHAERTVQHFTPDVAASYPLVTVGVDQERDEEAVVRCVS